METLVTDLQKPIGEKLVYANTINNSNYDNDLLFNCVESWKFLVHMDMLRNEYTIITEIPR